MMDSAEKDAEGGWFWVGWLRAFTFLSPGGGLSAGGVKTVFLTDVTVSEHCWLALVSI